VAINGKWFRAKLVEKSRSQRQLAKHLGLDPAAITLMLRGDRRMQLDEAKSIAAFIGEPLIDVLRAAGLPLRQSGSASIGMTPMPESAADSATVRDLVRKYNGLLAEAEKVARAIEVLKS